MNKARYRCWWTDGEKMTVTKSNAGILIVEGDAQLAQDLKSRLQTLEYDVCGTVTSAEQALTMVELERPDLVMLDIEIHGAMDGIEAAEVIRDRWGIPVVFLAAYADTDRLERAKLTYPFGYIIKPFQDRDLKITVEMALYVAEVDAERRRAEEALRKSERTLRAVLDAVPHHIHAKDGEGRFIMANKAVAESYHMTPEEFVGQYHTAVGMDEAEVKQMLADDKEVIDTGRPKHIPEETCIDADGNVHWLSTIKVPFDHDGEPAVLVVAIDITDHKRAEDALRESEEKYRLLVEYANDVIFIIQDGRVKFPNPKAMHLTGFSAEELMGADSFAEFIHPEDRQMVIERHMMRLAGDELAPQYPFRILTKSGDTLWIELNAALITWEGRPATLNIIRDISQQKQLEAQLQQAHKMEAVGTLAGGIAHDFNNLLQAINGYTQILMMDIDAGDPGYSHLNAINKAGDRAAQLIRQLLLFSRKAETERKPLDLNQEVEQARIILERTIPRMIDIEIHPGRRLWTVSADPVQIEQVLLNFGSNAADAMLEGGKLTIRTENATIAGEIDKKYLGVEPGRYVCLTVTDTGNGMDEETVAHIFEPFYTTKETGKGTGLGLASVYGIVKSHGGYISCQSKLGQGTTFRIYLPASDEEDGSTEEYGNGSLKGGPETILVVDDEASIRDLTTETFERFGYKVLIATCGEDALEVYADPDNHVDLVVLDLGMPGMGGLKCLHEILSLDPASKIVVASGYSVDGQVKKTLELGAKGFVAKPYQLADLLATVRAVLDSDN
jgi:two-component system cell cycle sensor histidine kinase/response regulator CckA